MALTWEDRMVKFDIPFHEMRLKPGEKIVDRLDSIEDTKGNGGDRGRLIITTLRILWHSVSSPRINLTIGYSCILNVSTKIVNSKLRGTTQALHILTISNNSRFEFIFTNLIPGNTRHFTSVMGVHKAYISSKLYREQKLRGAVVQNKRLKVLPLEQVFTTANGVWNLSSDHGSLGTFIVSNVRVVWFADANEGFNISLPHMQIETIKIRDSKYGKTLVLTSREISGGDGGYVLGFRVDPEERLKTLDQELAAVNEVYRNNPIYGVEYNWRVAGGSAGRRMSGMDESGKEEKDGNGTSGQCLIDETSAEVAEPRGEMTNTLAAYLADEGHMVDRLPVYCESLGLAVEAIKEGYDLQKLWEVIST